MKFQFKAILTLSVLFVLFLSISLISAIKLKISPTPLSDAIITDINEPASFELEIKNLGENESFEIYSLVGMDISAVPPSSMPFEIGSGETKKIKIKVRPQNPSNLNKGPLTFEYLIRNSKKEIQKETLTVKILGLEDVFTISPESISPSMEEIKIFIENKVNIPFEKVKLKMNSVFFEYEDELSFLPLEKKTIAVTLNKEKIKTLVSGDYLMKSFLTTRGKTITKENIIKFLEQPGMESKEIKEGVLIERREILRKNVGNINKNVKILVTKNLISSLFTTFNIPPTKTEIRGFRKIYVWEKELIPNEEIDVVVKTNWIYPLLILILVIIAVILIKKNIEKDVSLRKEVSFIKAKGGQFALKVRIKVRAKKYLEKITITDKLPPVVELYEKFGTIAPDRVDLKNRRLEWNLESLHKDEERIFTYIIYSKIGIVGKFELPIARVTYERDGKIKEAFSNRSFFINEPKNK